VDREDELGMCRVFLELLPQGRDVNVDGARDWSCVVAPDVVEQLVAGQELAAMGDEVGLVLTVTTRIEGRGREIEFRRVYKAVK
jgi:hypothetical protein